MEWILVYVPVVRMSRSGLDFSFSKELLFFLNSSRERRWSLLILEIQFPTPLFLHSFKTTRNEKWSIYGRTLYPLRSSRSHGYSHNSLMLSGVLLLQNGPVYLFNYLYGIFRYTTFHILFLPFFYNNEGKK